MLEGWVFSPAFDDIFTANIYIGNAGGEEGFTSHAGVLLSRMSRHNTIV